MTVVLPIIAILSITGEWSQRSGLTTFTLVPHRNRVVAAKAVSSVAVAVASMLFAFVIGAVGNVVGTAIAGTRPGVGRLGRARALNIVLGSLLCLLTGTMLGMLIRSSAGALVAYFVYSLLLPTVVRHPGRQPGVVPGPAAMGGPQLRPGRPVRGHAHRLSSGRNVAVTASMWLVLPAILGLRLVMRSEVEVATARSDPDRHRRLRGPVARPSDRASTLPVTTRSGSHPERVRRCGRRRGSASKLPLEADRQRLHPESAEPPFRLQRRSSRPAPPAFVHAAPGWLRSPAPPYRPGPG